MHPPTLRGLAALALTAPSLALQGARDLFVCDTDGDKIWACSDGDGDGDFDGANEVTPFYDELLGPFPLSVNAGLLRAPDGALFVTDSTEDFVLRLVDLDGNGDAHGANEATLWFDGRVGGNAAGILLVSARGMWRDPDGVLWVASANTGAGGNDAIVRLEDLNGDGDANDLLEAREYFVVAPGAAIGASIPTAVLRGRDGALYYAENGTGASPARGVYRLEDLDNSGTIDQPNEVTPFFLAPPQSGTAFHWDLSRDDTGALYLTDTGNDLIWRIDDTNTNGVIDAGEETLFWTSPGASNVWDLDVAPDGALYLVEDQTPDRLLRLFDTDGNGVIDPLNEVSVLYDDTLAAVDLGSPRAIAVVKGAPRIGVSYCGPAAPNTTGQGASLTATGSTHAAANDVVLAAQDLPANQFGFFLTSLTTGFVANPGGSQGDLCLGGTIGRYVRAGQIQNAGSLGTIALTLDLSLTPAGSAFVSIQAGETWHFQAWYRDIGPGGAPWSNFTDGLSIGFN